MFFLPVEFSNKVNTEELWNPEGIQMSATKLNFSGPFSGSFVLFIPEEFAVSITADFLGKDKKEVSQDNVTETSKEIINMIAGSTFANLDDQAVFDLKIPENILFEHAVNFSRTEDDIYVKIITLDNYFVLKMVIG
jgi:chemotaxis protein CheY-P-specific phosphatase CheC